jgi:hypothetical protein
MDTSATDGYEVDTRTLTFGLLGGAVAWLGHLLAAYLIAEFGCLSQLKDTMFMGLTAVAWLILAVSVVTLLAAAAATVVAWMAWRRLKAYPHETTDPRGAVAHFAYAGMIMSGLFTFVIAVESIPIFWFLREC